MKLKMKETLARVLSYLFKCEKKTLLWTNPHPYGSFSAQTVQLNLSGYDAVEVLFRHWTDSAYCAFAKCEKGNNCGMATVPSNVNAGIMRRGFSITNSGVAFDDGQGVKYDGTYQTGLSDAAVPQKIYGIVGGVLRNPVISRLTAIFTSLLFGGDVDEAEHKEAIGEGSRKTTEYSDNKTGRISYNKRYSTNIWGIFLGSEHISKWMVAAPILVSIRELCDHNSGSRSIRLDTDNRVQHQSFAANYCACAVHEGVTISERRWAA